MPIPREKAHLARGRKIKRYFVIVTKRGRKMLEGVVLTGQGPHGGKTIAWVRKGRAAKPRTRYANPFSKKRK